MDYSQSAISKGPTRKQTKAAKDRAQATVDRAVYAAVDARDMGQCRKCGAFTSDFVPKTHSHSRHRHHLLYRSLGGLTTVHNVLTLCGQHHRMVHDKVLDFAGNSAEDMSAGWTWHNENSPSRR